MIFKKIYTFLNDYFNGNKISKAFSTLIFTLIFSSTLFYSSEVSAYIPSEYSNYEIDNEENDQDDPVKASRVQVETYKKQPGEASFIKNGSGDQEKEFYILYKKAGLPDNRIYTSYLPPKNTYNKSATTEHTLGYCGDLGESGLRMIGRDCMIKIPFDCNDTSPGNFPNGIQKVPGENCLFYSNVFTQGAIEGKKLGPKKCEAGKTHGRDCLTTDKNYCHITNKPILGINCKLAPCNSIPNQHYRRPGVNCLADCNKSPGDDISQEKFFMEGFNCLSSCGTFVQPATAPPGTSFIGQNCVLEFNNYVMPLCSDYLGAADSKHFNKNVKQIRRKDCVNLVDLPLNVGHNGQIDLINSVRECSASGQSHNKDCVNFNSASESQYGGYTKKECHRYTSLASLNADAGINIICPKINCHELSDSELARSFNEFNLASGLSSAKYCNPTVYREFSLAQVKGIDKASTPYLKDYLLDYKPCYSRGDTEEIETIVSSIFYGGEGDNAKINFLKKHARESINGQQDPEGLYDESLICPMHDVSQEISCEDYKSNDRIPPYDCNARSYCPDCPQGSDICGRDGDKYCYKNNINCNDAINDIYAVCRLESSEPKPDKDEYVSWFFRPTVPKEALQKKGNEASYSLIDMQGYPFENEYKSEGNDDIYMDKKSVEINGLGKISQPFDVLWTSRVITPPSIGNSIGIPGVGAGYICGMDGDYRGIPSDEATYFRGEVKTTYEADNKASHEVDVCIRYASGSAPQESCGYRMCKTSCAFGACSKLCGIDVCRTLKIKEGSNQNCSSIKSEDKDCIKNYQTGLDAISRNTRVRIYKPDSSNYICAVLEFYGITTDMKRRPFMNGTEFFEVPDQNDRKKTKKICVKGGSYIESSNSCKGDSGSDSNSNDAISEQWRTSKIIKYITAPPIKDDKDDTYYTDSSKARGENNLKSQHIDIRTDQKVNQTIGRVKFNIKRYFEKSDCIRHKERVAGPVFFSIATPANSERLFLPAIEIVDKCRIATSEANCDPVDETDFFLPSITIKYGKIIGSNSILSKSTSDLNTNYKIIKIDNPQSSISEDYKIKAANTGITGINIEADVFIKKESSGFQPRVCLYKKISQDKSQVIECVNRKRATRAKIEEPSALSHTSLSFQVGFLKDEGSLHSSITTDLPTQPFVFQGMLNKINSKELLKVCSEFPAQGFPICIERDECTLLNNECVENERSLTKERNKPSPDYAVIKQKEPVSKYCIKELLVKCNLRKGYALTADNQTLNTSREKGKGFNAPTDTDSMGESMYHGWFNEFCIVNGIAKLDDPNAKIYVERNVTINGQLGSCKKDPTCLASPLNATCIANGGCLRTSCCKIVESTTLLSSPATPHELGLCLPIENYLKSCPAISYAEESNLIDPFFIGDSYLSMNPPHLSHINRKASSYNSFHAEYEVAYADSSSIKGKCEGFYKYKTIDTYPSANCDSQGNWEASSFTNECIMHSCPAKKLSDDKIGNKLIGADQFGQYPFSYDSIKSPDGSLRGFIHGYANWEAKDKTTLLKESVEATSCIVGYAQKNAINSTATSADITPNINAYINTFTGADKVAINKAINSLYGNYTGLFSGGVKPTRNCNQLGVWEVVTNSCERITCPPINFASPAEAGAFNMNDYELKFETSTSGKKVIFSKKSPYSSMDPIPRKVKFKIASIYNDSVYLAVDNSGVNSVNSFLIKDSSGLNPATININQFYVLELTDSDPANKYWKIIQNTNDEALIALWGQSGGASFGQGFALRSNLYNYPESGPNTLDNHKVTGVCNEAMLYKALGSSPQLTCDSNGNWVNLINPCVSDCKAISEDVGNNAIHGYSMWNKSETKVSSSDVVTSTGCVTGFHKYPYPPLFDNEGAKKDFGIQAVANGNIPFMTSDSYHAIAKANDGATFVATAEDGENLEPALMNRGGYAYNLKIQTSNSQSQSVASSGPQGSEQNVFYLFNNAPLAMTPQPNKVWSKIKFSSFGTPKYNPRIEQKDSCHLIYSKLILANKCIGQTTCSISLSDFTGYDTNACNTANPGNGENGQQNNGFKSFGSGGGGGGGNNPGSGGSPTSSININGSSGSSFYDTSFHLNAPTLLDAGNKGLKVDLKVADTGKFKGQDGSVKIMESTTQDFSSIAKTSNYTTPGEQTHTVTTGSADQDIYIKYEMSGAGGGGGGQGLTQGTDGASGAKMTGGIFKVKHGTVLKIYVGGGGGAGKTKCAPPPVSFLDPNIIQPAFEIIEPAKKTNFAIKTLENNNLNSHQIIAQNTKISDHNSTIKSSLAKIFSKISDIFISEGYAEVLTFGNDAHSNWNETQGFGSNSGNIYYKCDHAKVLDHFIQSDGKIYIGVRGFDHGSYSVYHHDYVASLSKKDGLLIKFLKGISSIFLSNAYAQVTVYHDEKYASTGFLQAFYVSDVALPTFYIQKDQISSIKIATGYVLTAYFKKTEYPKINRILKSGNYPSLKETYYEGTGDTRRSLNNNIWDLVIRCDTGYKDSKNAFGLILCVPSVTCNVPTTANVTETSVIYTTTAQSLTCKPGYAGSPKYTCTTTGPATVTGSCVAIKCSSSAINGLSSVTLTNLNFTGTTTGTVTCSGAAYTGAASYTCTGTTNPGTFAITSACACASGFAKNSHGACDQSITCNVPTAANVTETSVNYITTATSLTCKPGYVGSPKYTCTTTGPATVTGSCAAIKCSSSGTNYNGLPSTTLTDLNFTGETASTVNCSGTAYTGTASYTCTGTTNPGIFAITSACGCATGFAKDANGICVAIKCWAPEGLGYSQQNLLYYSNNNLSITCDKVGYTGTVGYTCTELQASFGLAENIGKCGCATGYTKNASEVCVQSANCTVPDTFNVTQTSVSFASTSTTGLTCKDGFTGSPTYTCIGGVYTQTGTCNPISCSIPSGVGYAAKPSKSGSGSFNCDAGYVGTIFYTCLSGNPSFRIDSGSCIGIKCNLPAEANSDIIPLANSNPAYRQVDYSPISAPKTYKCASGYIEKYDSTLLTLVDPTYTCETNNAVAEYQNACEIVKCYSYGQKTYEYKDGNSESEDCNTSSGYWGVSTFTCEISGALVWNTPCKIIKCLIPVGRNTTADGKLVDFSASFFGLECAQGYYYEEATRPKYTCLYKDDTTLPDRGILDFQGSCSRITCQIPIILNSVKDNTSVEWNGSNYITTTCKAGFYQVSADLAPKYSCSGGSKIGELRTANPCAPVTCDLPFRFGMLAKTNLEYGVNKTTSCDKSGYSGSVTYTCGLPLLSQPGKGTVTGVSSTCKEASCDVTVNLQATFNTYVTSTAGAGGAGGKISNTIGFLNGGNGGNTATSRTSGSGGGGGSASMIALNDKRIIAIAGGGGGGAGGGEDANSSNAVAKVSNVANLDNELISNVFGPYFIGEMQSSQINFNAQKTAGILYGKVASPATQFSLVSGTQTGEVPPGTFINEIFFASYGAPSLPQSNIWKYGSCHDPSSLTQSLNQCAGKTSCSIATSDFSDCQSLVTKEFGLVASYYFKEPTLQVVNIVGLPEYKIKEENSENQLDLKDGEVYTFVLGKENNISTWVKYNYLSDEYRISLPIPDGTKKIKVKFHRTNSTFSPTLKTRLSSWPLKIVKSYELGKATSLSVGYIDKDKEYILTLDNNNWIIREYTDGRVDGALDEDKRTLPKRSCATNKVFSTGAVNVAWSLPNSSCVNYCPGYEVINGIGIGDDRINVGATQHVISSGATGVVYWKNGQIGSHSVMKFSNAINNGVFPEYTGRVSASDFRSNSARQYFALSRFCNEKGVWSDPVPLCAFSPVGNNDDSGIPVADGKSYIQFSQEQTLFEYADSKYLRINTDDTATTSCKELHYQQTDDAFFKPNISRSYQPPKYKCVSSDSKIVDRTFFQEVADSDRSPCAQYCFYNRIPQDTVSYDNQGAYMVRVKGDILRNGLQVNETIQLGCAPGFLNKLIMQSTTLVRSNINPKIECTRTGGLANWGGIQDNCEVARRCFISSLSENEGSLSLGRNWFPLAKYIAPEHRDADSMASGTTKAFPKDPSFYQGRFGYERQFGKCGYCTYQFESCTIGGCSKRGYHRKYLKSYSCNDGIWSAEWDREDGVTNRYTCYIQPCRPQTYNRACDDDDWDWSRENEEDHPNQLYLGNCEGENITKAFANYKNLENWP